MRRGSMFSSGTERGTSVVEVALFLPWIVICFLAVLDFGYCAYGLIATQDAARIGAEWGAATSSNASSSNLSSQACHYATQALEYAPGVGTSVTTCGGTSPISVTATYHASGSDGLPTVTVSVSYTVSLLYLVGTFPSSFTITRAVEFPVRN